MLDNHSFACPSNLSLFAQLTILFHNIYSQVIRLAHDKVLQRI